MVAAVLFPERPSVEFSWTDFAEDLVTLFTEDSNMPDEQVVDRGKLYTSKQPLPRQLGMNENMRTLRHWWGTLRNYYRLCDINGHFLNDTLTWNPAAGDYALAAETTGLKRTPAILKQDLVAFLETVGGYLPHAYVTESLVSGTTSIKEVRAVIEGLYGAQVTPASFLQLNSFKKETEESHKQFFERLVDHCRQHLVRDEVKIEGRATASDKLTCLSLNLIAIFWMNKIHPKLLSIVQVEYASRLKGQEQIAALVLEIALCADELLSRHELGAGVRHVTDEGNGLVAVPQVNKVNFPQQRRKNDGFNKKSGLSGNQPKSQAERKCPHCVFLSGALKARLNVNHNPDECFRKDISIRMLEAWGDQEEEISSGINDIPINPQLCVFSHYRSYLQNEPGSEIYEMKNGSCDNEMKNDVVMKVGVHVSQRFDLSDPACDAAVRKVAQRWRAKKSTRKRRSPAFTAKVNGHVVKAVVDEGSEVNVIEEKVVLKAGVKVDPVTDTRATAAGSNPLLVIGQCHDHLVLDVEVEGVSIPVDLGHAVVIRGLGADLLVGEPGKCDNKIHTIPEHRLIEFNHEGQTLTTHYDTGPNPDYEVGRVMETRTLQPGESLRVAVSNFDQGQIVAICPRREDGNWFDPGLVTIDDGVELINTSSHSVTLKKGNRVCEVRNVIEVSPEEIVNLRKVFNEFPDSFQYKSLAKPPNDKSYLDDIQVDPDGIMTPSQKKMFRDLCAKYTDIITPRPGRYNNHSGHVDNSINFAERPPSNQKVYQPKYSDKMKELLGQKMDALEDWGVLTFPDKVGVSIEFLSPSMLVPKSEKDEFRMVSDLCGLNRYIKKPPTTSPSIQEAKEDLAKKRYFAHIDLSNYYYQSGMSREDIQWLGVLHPFKGVMCYACEPQGLKGASEHAYEKLSRIFGSLCRAGKAIRQADSLFAVGDTLEELRDNLELVFERVQLNGLTIKPSKIIVAPRKSVLFGWEWCEGKWSPTSHVTSALERVPLPKTSTQLRSYLGSFKQFSDCISNYGEILSALEKMTSGKGVKLQWTPEQEKAFKESQDAIKSLLGVYIPRPEDQLVTYSDYSEENNAIGGRLEIHREEDGKIKKLHGGFFSATLPKVKKRWPCEGECQAVKSVVEFFADSIRNSKKLTIHYSDNSPTVSAWNLAKKGAYSTSPKMSAFLSSLSTLNIDIRHKPGKDMHTSDYLSRHPSTCTHERCSVCTDIRKWTEIGEKCNAIRSVSIEDVMSGDTAMPFHQRKTWLTLQTSDSMHAKLKHLIEVSQVPEKKRTKGEFTRLKLMHNLFQRGDLRVESDGLITVRPKSSLTDQWAISVPTNTYPSLVMALHQKFSHPSKQQLSNLLSRYYYCTGQQAIIEDVTNSCKQCLTTRQLPKVLTDFSTTSPGAFGTRFSTDILERCQQRILVTVEDGSGLTMTDLVDNQKAETIRPAILAQVLPLMPMSGAVIRSDNAPSHQSLKLEAEEKDSVWSRHNITWELGATYNVNKNPVCENKIRELEKEILRFKASGGPLTKLDLVQITNLVNTRVRHHGKSAKELLLRREAMNNTPIDVSDSEVATQVETNRDVNHANLQKHHRKRGKKEAPEMDFQVGDLVLVRDTLSKHKPREVHTVVELDGNENVKIKKFENQLRQKTFDVKPSQLIPYFSYRPGPEQPAGAGEIDLEKIAKEHQSPKRPRVENDESDESLENSALNNNIVEISDSSSSDNSKNNTSIEIIENIEHIEKAKPAGKGAPGPLTDQYKKSLRSKRSAAVKANEKLKEWAEMDDLVKVYRNYIHGWDENENKKLVCVDDHLMELDQKVCNDTIENGIGFEEDIERVNDLVEEYQAFLTNRDQSEHDDPTWVPDESDDSDDYIDASMIPNVGSESRDINTQELGESSTQLWEAALETPPSPPSHTQLQFDIGISSSSTQRPRPTRSTVRHDYKKMNEEGF